MAITAPVMPATEPTRFANDADAARREHLRALTTYSGRVTPAREALDALDDEGLRNFGLNGDYLNLLRLFGAQWTLDRIQETARAATRDRAWSNACYWNEFVRIFSQLTDVTDPVAERTRLARYARLDGWRHDPIRPLLAEERGVVLACFCISGFKQVCVDLVLRGYTFLQPIVTKAVPEAQELHRAGPPFFGQRANYVDVQANAPGALRVARTLKRGGLVNLNFDGMTRAFGPTTDAMWSVVPFAGLRVRVLNGIVRLAAAAGSTIVPVFVPRVSPVLHRVEFGEPMRTPRGLRGEELDGFVQTAMERLYGMLGEFVLEHPAQWARLSKFHEIRVPDAEPDPEVRVRQENPEAALAAFADAWQAGRPLALDTRRIARTEHLGRPAWINVYTLSSIALPETAVPVFDLLNGGAPASPAAIDACFAGSSPVAAEAFCAELWRRGLLKLAS